MSAICGEFKFASENNYQKFLEAMEVPRAMLEHVMSSLQNVYIIF